MLQNIYKMMLEKQENSLRQTYCFHYRLDYFQKSAILIQGCEAPILTAGTQAGLQAGNAKAEATGIKSRCCPAPCSPGQEREYAFIYY